MSLTTNAAPGGSQDSYVLRVARTLYVGTTSVLAVLWVVGTLKVSGPVNFVQTTGVQTGAILQVDSVTRWQTLKGTCTATGGLTTYTTCSIRSPLTTTGTLLGAGIECGNVALELAGDVSFKKTLTSASGTVLTNLNNVSMGTGANVQSQLAVPLSWNPADLLTFTTLTTPTGTLNTTRYDCQMWATMSDKYGS